MTNLFNMRPSTNYDESAQTDNKVSLPLPWNLYSAV